jgi:hypothetical protein
MPIDNKLRHKQRLLRRVTGVSFLIRLIQGESPNTLRSYSRLNSSVPRATRMNQLACQLKTNKVESWCFWLGFRSIHSCNPSVLTSQIRSSWYSMRAMENLQMDGPDKSLETMLQASFQA